MAFPCLFPFAQKRPQAQEHMRHILGWSLLLRFHTYIWVSYLLMFICNPWSILVALLWSFVDLQTVTKDLIYSICMFPVAFEQRDTLPSCFSSHTVSVLFVDYLVPRFSLWCAFPRWFCSWRWFLRVVLKSCLVFLNARGCDVPYGEGTCGVSFIQARVTALVSLSSR